MRQCLCDSVDDEELSSDDGLDRLQELKAAGAVVVGPQPSLELQEIFLTAKKVMLNQFEHKLQSEDGSQLLAAVLPELSVSNSRALCFPSRFWAQSPDLAAATPLCDS